MIPLRLAVALRVFAEPLRTSLRSAVRIGVQGVQLDIDGELQPGELSRTGRQHLLHNLGELGLAVASLTFSTRRPFTDLTELDSRLVLCRAAMTLAHDLEAKVFTLRIGRFPDGNGASEASLLRDVLNDLARHGNHVGVSLAVTPSGDSAASLLGILAAVKSGPVGVDFDPAAFVLSGQSPEDALDVLKGILVNFMVRDALKDVDGGGVETAVGQGDVPWGEMLARLEEVEYGGWLTIDRTQGDKPRDAARAVAYLQNMLMG